MHFLHLEECYDWSTYFHDSADICGTGTRDEPPKDVCVGGLRPPGCIKVERVESRRPILKFNIY